MKAHPIALSALVENIGAFGTKGVANNSLLRNPFRTPMLIDQINFAIEMDVAANSGGDGGTTMQVEFSLGPLQLSRGYQPISAFCKTMDWAALAETNYLNWSNWIWRPAKPIYIPAGEYLVPTFYNAGLCSGTRDVRITYIGRSLPKGYADPKTVDLPWVTSFVGTTRAGGTDFTDQSNEIDLANPFTVPLNLYRMTGRVSNSSSSTQQDSMCQQSATVPVAAAYTFIRMVSSDNNVIICNDTPMHLVFGTPQALDIKTILEPNSFFRAFLIENYASIGGTSYTPVISILGDREVRL